MHRLLLTIILLIVLVIGIVVGNLWAAGEPPRTILEPVDRKIAVPLVGPGDRIDITDVRRGAGEVTARLPAEPRLWETAGTSMLPAVGEGHIQVTIQLPIEEIQVGDVLVFQDVLTGQFIGHRVVAIEEDTQGWYARTQGDRNFDPDLFKVREYKVIGIMITTFY